MIDVRIPYKPNDLAGAYNKVMEESTSKWVLLLDHDVFLATNKDWYNILLKAISKLKDPDKVGMITCIRQDTFIDRPQCPDIPMSEATDNIRKHVVHSKNLYKKYGITLREVKVRHLGGFFMLVNRDVWKNVKFRNKNKGIYFIDWDFAQRLLDNNYKIYVLPGLYLYHGKKVKE